MALKILIAPASPEVVEPLPDWLQRAGCETLLAPEGPQALALAEERRPDVILLGPALPGLEGPAACHLLRLNPVAGQIPVVLVAPRAAPQVCAEALRAGAADCLSGPIQFPDLLARLSALAENAPDPQAATAFRRQVLDTLDEGLIVVDEQGTIAYANQRLLRLTGYRRDLLYGQSIGQLFHPDDRAKQVSSLTGEHRSTLPFETRLLTREGQSLPVQIARSFLPDGDSASTVIVVTDRSALVQSSEALAQQTLRLQALNRAANAISAARTFQEVVTVILETALEMVRGRTASLLLRDAASPDTLLLTGSLQRAIPGVEPVPARLDESLALWVANHARAQLLLPPPRPGDPAGEARSALAVPLIASNDVTGVLEVVDKSEGLFDEADLEALESLASSSAIAIENARLFDQTHRRVSELSTLLDASAAVSSTLDFGDILERIARRLSMALQVERVVIADWDRAGDCLVTMAEVVNVHWPLEAGPLRDPAAIPLTQAVFASGEPLHDLTAAYDELNPSGLVALAGFPLGTGADLLGVVTLYGETPGQPLVPDVVPAVSSMIARWLDRLRGQEGIDWFSRANLSDLCQRALQASGARWCSVAAWDEAAGQFRLLREIGRSLWLDRPGPDWEVARYHSMGQVLAAGEARTLPLEQLDADPAERDYLLDVGGGTCLIAPLFVRGESRGLVKLVDSQRERRIFDSSELSLCQGIANVVGNALENAQLYRTLEHRASALEAAYTELEDADRMKIELIQNLSHELRTPLTHILGYLRLLGEGAFGDLNSEQVETVNLVLAKAEHLVDLVNDITAVQDSGMENLNLKPIHLERVVAQAIRAMAGQAEARSLRIVPRIPAHLPVVYADPARLGEVFEELLENAIKFSPNPGEIEVTLDDSGGPVLHACVCDQGIGIDPAEHEKIFRRFYQVDSGTARRFGGIGLGLAVVKRVVERHNGQIWVESQPGQGSCFHLTLPKIRAAADEG